MAHDLAFSLKLWVVARHSLWVTHDLVCLAIRDPQVQPIRYDFLSHESQLVGSPLAT